VRLKSEKNAAYSDSSLLNQPMVMSDATLAPDTVSLSLPHRTSNQRQEIMTGFLGITTWQALCQKLDIGRNLLINDLSQDDDVEPRKK
jgi:hypothetical protein